ncbi:MAG: neutral/alkaline non-lysosomal ceramidase N-terminal domain-containing protein, partial [Planctomycetota bacterium]|nr:neutral/alkaline non-lysosomal ceramidase N-terminal domain-containing protein [Planctomycetota bacterium]
MISYLRGPGGPLRRLAAEWVPFSIAVVVGGVWMPLTSPLNAALVATAAWPLASAALRWVRRRPGLRRLYRLALLGHVVFWSFQGVAATTRTPAAVPEVGAASAWAASGGFTAGQASRPFVLPAWAPIAGWGSPPRRIRLPVFGGLGFLGRHGQALMAEPREGGQPWLPLFRAGEAGQALGARALVLRPEGEGAPLAIVRVDLVTSDGALHAALLERIAPLGFRAEGVLLAATHTHSGPGGYAANPASALFGTDHLSPALVQAVLDAAAGAVEDATARAIPARIALVKAHDRDPTTGAPIIARNRRAGDEDAIDDRVYCLRVDGREDGVPIAVVLNYALHPHMHRRRNMLFDRDLAGGIEEALTERLEGHPAVLFVNGAQGDISTREGAGAPPERIAELAARFADAVAPDVVAAAAHAVPTLRVACARCERRMATPRVIVAALGERAGALSAVDRPYTELEAWSTAADVVAAPLNIALWTLMLDNVRVGFTWDGDVGAAVQLERTMGNDALPFGAWVFELGDGGV